METELDELIARVEKATGPDREIDFAIGEMLLGFERCNIQESDGPCNEVHQAGNYTSSLDAVVVLVERELPGCKWTASNYCGAFLHHAGGMTWSGTYGPSSALALLLALLRAKLQASRSHEGPQP